MAQLVDYLQLNNLFALNQFEFRKHRSVQEDQLLTYGEVTWMVDSGYMVDVVFLDFSKVFDVSHYFFCQSCRYWRQAAGLD